MLILVKMVCSDCSSYSCSTMPVQQSPIPNYLSTEGAVQYSSLGNIDYASLMSVGGGQVDYSVM